MKNNYLDKYCSQIFAAILKEMGEGKKEVGYNELWRRLNNDVGFKISRQALSRHLIHLLDQSLITKKTINRNTTAYRHNFKEIPYNHADLYMKNGSEFFFLLNFLIIKNPKSSIFRLFDHRIIAAKIPIPEDKLPIPRNQFYQVRLTLNKPLA
jgi:hypothetical protein